MLRQALAFCNGSGEAGAGSPFDWQQNTIAGGVRTADSWVPHVSVQAAYPPPRESCVRGADRAAVDKSSDPLLRDRPSLAVSMTGSFVLQALSRPAHCIVEMIEQFSHPREALPGFAVGMRPKHLACYRLLS